MIDGRTGPTGDIEADGGGWDGWSLGEVDWRGFGGSPGEEFERWDEGSGVRG